MVDQSASVTGSGMKGQLVGPRVFLIAAVCLSALIKSLNLGAGGPQIEIDDYSLYEGGFLVWFGNVPPQHGYLESWFCGLTSVATYLVSTIATKGLGSVLVLDLIPQAYRDFYLFPDKYYFNYRTLATLVDLATALIVYAMARSVLKDRWKGFASALVAVLYLFTYNTVWCNLIGRPDTWTAFFATVGMWSYLKSNHERSSPYFVGSAVAFGAAAGLKLHGAFFAVFAVVDLFRALRFRDALKAAWVFVPISIFLFAVCDGSLLFDPLKYVKARLLTYGDDYTPSLAWGGQFLTILKGSGWLVAPLVLLSPLALRIKDPNKEEAGIRSVVCFALCWLALFGSIRQLRAYWMLPALPLFYISAVYCLDALKWRAAKLLISAALVVICCVSTVQYAVAIRNSDLNGLRRWVTENINPNEPFYIIGHQVLKIPRNTKSMSLTRAGYQRTFEQDLKSGMCFTERHLKNWEEQSTLQLLDMLNVNIEGGYEYYSCYSHPLAKFKDIIDIHSMKYIIIQESFDWSDLMGIDASISSSYRQVVKCTGEGGGGYGRVYTIYATNIE